MNPVYPVSIDEVRFIQEQTETSAAGATGITISLVPARRIRIIYAADVKPSVAETQDYACSLRTKAGNDITLQNDNNQDLTTAIGYALRRIVTLYPGEQLVFFRGAATAGSTFSARVVFVELGVPALQAGLTRSLAPTVADQPPSLIPEGPGPPVIESPSFVKGISEF